MNTPSAPNEPATTNPWHAEQPTIIERPEDLLPGDRVRLTIQAGGGDTIIHEFTVARIRASRVHDKMDEHRFFALLDPLDIEGLKDSERDRTWELLHRPTPEATGEHP